MLCCITLKLDGSQESAYVGHTVINGQQMCYLLTVIENESESSGVIWGAKWQAQIGVYIGWQWRNLFIPIYASCSGRCNVEQANVNILQHLQSDRRSKLFWNLLI